MAKIHPSSIVHPDAQLADSVEVGPFCIIGPTVKIGAGTVLRSHVVVEGRTTIGENNVVFAGASVGCQPQDKKYAGEDTALVVGDRNVIRENCTLSIGTVQDKGLTVVGSGNLFMANVHIAHDCQVGSQTIWPTTWPWLVTSWWKTTRSWAARVQCTSSCALALTPWWAGCRRFCVTCLPM